MTQYQKILTIMLRNPNKDWWYPYDFMRGDLGNLFVGYEASARLSELATNYPDMLESKRAGKYIVRRMRYQNYKNFIDGLPNELKEPFYNELQGFIQKTGQPRLF